MYRGVPFRICCTPLHCERKVRQSQAPSHHLLPKPSFSRADGERAGVSVPQDHAASPASAHPSAPGRIGDEVLQSGIYLDRGWARQCSFPTRSHPFSLRSAHSSCKSMSTNFYRFHQQSCQVPQRQISIAKAHSQNLCACLFREEECFNIETPELLEEARSSTIDLFCIRECHPLQYAFQ